MPGDRVGSLAVRRGRVHPALRKMRSFINARACSGPSLIGGIALKSAKLMTWMVAAAVGVGLAPTAMAATATMTPEAVNATDPAAVVTSGSTGAAVLRAQILLDRARFSPGEIDAAYGSNMRRAIAGFQASNGIEPTGSMDAATWAALDRDTAPALVSLHAQRRGRGRSVQQDAVRHDGKVEAASARLRLVRSRRWPKNSMPARACCRSSTRARTSPAAAKRSSCRTWIEHADAGGGQGGRRQIRLHRLAARCGGQDGGAISRVDRQRARSFAGRRLEDPGRGHQSDLPTTTRTCSGTPIRRIPRPRSRPVRTIRSAWSGSTCRRSITASTALPSRRRSARPNPMAASA